ncbi:MAG: hypothetical protein P8M30_06070 [Planctomycetaceae bacterium]|nr:hypothetical protein [Planctomycetaceae bacterium]
MRPQFWLIGVGLLCLSVAAVADDITDPSPTTPGSGVIRDHAHPKLIVTTLGRLVEGDITYSGSGYVVDVRGGSMLVPFKLVKFTADSRHDAYLKYRKLMPEQTSGNHVVLAKWCLQYNLANDAIHELKQALYLDEANQDAAKLLVYLENKKNRGESASPSAQKTRSPLKRAVSLQGLSPESIGEYTTAIQPVLMNNCAKAGCHHSQTTNDLQLQYVRLTGYGNRIASSENLAKVLVQIDVNNPRQSPLLLKARSNHGTARDTLVHAPQGKEILNRIEAWILKTSQELNPTGANDSHRVTKSQPNTTTLNPQQQLVRDSVPEDREQFIKKILDKQRNDPFSPDQFNQTVRPSGN